MSDIEKFFSQFEGWQLGLMGAGVALLVCSLIICLCYCYFRRFRYRPDEADLAMARYINDQNQYSRQLSLSSRTKNLGAAPSSVLAGKFKQKPKKTGNDLESGGGAVDTNGVDTSSITPTKNAAGVKEFSPNVMANLTAKMKVPAPSPPPPPKASVQQESNKSTRQDKGQSYGRLDVEAQERIRSVRLQAQDLNIKPIQPMKPNAKALKMMGITEEEASKQYAESVENRMKRIAENAGGGLYSAGFSTAKLGAEIIDGFKTRRENLQAKAERKKEAVEYKQEMENKRKTLDQKIAPITPPLPASESAPKYVPHKVKPKGLKAFLQEEEGDKKKDEKKDDDDNIDKEL